MGGWVTGKGWAGPQELNGWDSDKPQKKKSSFTSCPPVDNLEFKVSYFFRGVVPAAGSVLVISTASSS